MDETDLRNAGVDDMDIPHVRVEHGLLIWDPETCPHHMGHKHYTVSDENGNDKPVGTFCFLCGGWLTLEEGQPALPIRIRSPRKSLHDDAFWGYKHKETA